ncbi:MAG: hypothetical protein WDN30_16105 [Pararobbsia sp.]
MSSIAPALGGTVSSASGNGGGGSAGAAGAGLGAVSSLLSSVTGALGGVGGLSVGGPVNNSSQVSRASEKDAGGGGALRGTH